MFTVNYLKEQLEDHFAEFIQGVKVNTVCEPKYLGTMGSIRFVEQFHNDTILVMNSDLFTDIDYEDFYLHFKQNNADMSVAALTLCGERSVWYHGSGRTSVERHDREADL